MDQIFPIGLFVVFRYERYVKPAYENFIEPSSKRADLIVPNAGMNEIAIEVIAQWIKTKSCRLGAHTTQTPRLEF